MSPNGTMRPTRYVRERRPSIDRRLVWVLLAAFLVAALATAYITFILLRSVVANSSTSAKTKGGVIPSTTTTSIPFSLKLLTKPLQPTDGPDPKDWDGKSRIYILVMGLDYRDWEDNNNGPSRTDSMILFSIDPATRSAGMLSIPRDLWVDIPGYEAAKINSANFIGDAQHMPGGGAALALTCAPKSNTIWSPAVTFRG